MSVNIVFSDTLDLLITAFIKAYEGRWPCYLTWMDANGETQFELLSQNSADGIGERLSNLNLQRLGQPEVTSSRYSFRPVDPADVDPVVVLKNISYYEYQSRTDGWERTWAGAFCGELRGAVSELLPGYDRAPWGWERPPQLMNGGFAWRLAGSR